jgi:hypothetical protein
MFQKFMIEVSKTVQKGGKNVREKVGEVFAFSPLMDEIRKISAAAEQAQAVDKDDKPVFDKEGKPVPATDERGLPVYNSEEANWLFSAVVAAVTMQARNKLVSGTATLKDAAVIATDWAGLVAEGGSGNGAALAALRDCQNAFAAYVGTLGKTEAVAKMLIVFFKNKDALETQTASTKAKMLEYVEGFAATLNEADLDRFDKPIQRVMESCATATADPTSLM